VQKNRETEKTPSTDAADDSLEAPIIKEPPADGIKRRWYAVHAHSGQEGSVLASLRARSVQNGMENMITNVLVPMEEVAEFRAGEKKTSKRKFFPGYVLIQLPEHPEKNADLWHLIKDTPGVTGFIGSRTEPVPLDDTEVRMLVEEMRGERERPRPKLSFDVGERVKITEGAFANFMGNIGEINEERGKVKVMIEIFERQTSVEVDFWQVEKI
jgi:transcriptional antiterminator NusG